MKNINELFEANSIKETVQTQAKSGQSSKNCKLAHKKYTAHAYKTKQEFLSRLATYDGITVSYTKVADKLLDFSLRSGVAKAGKKAIAEHTGLSESTIKRAFRWFRKTGVFELVERKIESGVYTGRDLCHFFRPRIELFNISPPKHWLLYWEACGHFCKKSIAACRNLLVKVFKTSRKPKRNEGGHRRSPYRNHNNNKNHNSRTHTLSTGSTYADTRNFDAKASDKRARELNSLLQEDKKRIKALEDAKASKSEGRSWIDKMRGRA